MSEPIVRVRVEGLCKDFAKHRGQFTAFDLVRRWMASEPHEPSVHHALHDVSLIAREGELTGLIGNNGAGKTTLLKTIAGIYAPTSGTVEIRGEMGLLSGLGVGMIDDLPVRENVFLYGSICRLSRPRVMEIFDEILDWADLGDFADTPVRNLSAGMRTRLAFSIAMRIDAQVLLIDEALSAGDQRFKEKCEAYFEELRGGDQTVIISTHDLSFVETYCHSTLWLQNGRERAYGPTEEVVARYRAAASAG